MESDVALTEAEQRCLDKCRQMEAECRSLWIRAIEYSPRLASYCPHWHDFTPQEWAILLAENSCFAAIAPLHLLGVREWYIILNRQIALIEKCPILNDFSDACWNDLQKRYPWIERQ